MLKNILQIGTGFFVMLTFLVSGCKKKQSTIDDTIYNIVNEINWLSDQGYEVRILPNGSIQFIQGDLVRTITTLRNSGSVIIPGWNQLTN